MRASPADCKSALRFPLSFPSPWLPAEYNSALPGRSQDCVLSEALLRG